MTYHIHTYEYYSAIQKEWSNIICSNIDEFRDYHIKWSKSDRERKISYAITYMWNLKKIVQINLQNINKLIDIEKKFMITKGYVGVDK